MKKIILKTRKGTSHEVLLDDEDFERVKNIKWHYHHGGHSDNWYAMTSGSVLMHRLIMNTPKGMEVDHINGNGLDNRRENLRICTVGQNRMNRKISKNNSSGFNGVYWEKAKNSWRVKIHANNRFIHVGNFVNLRKAAISYNEAAQRYFGEFARLNHI